MAGQARAPGKWGQSAPWNRLRPANIDELEQYGLPSKGETKLNNARAQENYYNKIVERYMKFCAESGGGDALDQAFASLTLSNENASSSTDARANSHESPILRPSTSSSTTHHTSARPTQMPTAKSTPNSTSVSTTSQPEPTSQQRELTRILLAMRKLRESLTATKRLDNFAQRAYVFIIRAAILCRHPDSYHPALQHLLRRIHPTTPLPPSEAREFAAYACLDLACRLGDLRGAHELRCQWRIGENAVLAARVNRVLAALARDDWVAFWTVRDLVDGYLRAVMGFADHGVRRHALKCLGRAYFQADVAYVEACAGAKWDELREMGVGWEREGDKVVIRRPKVK